uniref:Isoform 4 of Sex-lethal homolog n=2 Tax=Megaselia scalaris TaxID=36166 RepID=O01671-4
MYRGGRMWGMSHSLPSGMDTDFSSYPSTIGRQHSQQSQRYYQNNNCGLGSVGNMANSTNSLNSGTNNSGTNLIVNYLPQDMQDRELYSLFRTIGPINTCRIMRDYKTGYSYGYGFVDFGSEADALRAINNLNGITVRNKRIKVSFARPGGEQLRDTNLYVTNLSRSITDEQLETIFGKYGQIVQKNILRDKHTGTPRGVAFIRFNKREEAQEAISALNNVIPEGGTQPLTVRVAEEHGKSKGHVYMAPNQPPHGNMGHGNMGNMGHGNMGMAGGSGMNLNNMNAFNGMNQMVHRGRQKHSYQRKIHPYNPNFL